MTLDLIIKNLPAWLAVAALVPLSALSVSGQERIDVSNTHEILITSVRPSETFGDRQKGDEALLIQDKTEISKLTNLFQNNLQHKVHACGYNWRLTFFRTGSAPTDIYFNERCEEFDRNTELICELVQAKFRQVVTRPNGFVSNVEVDVAVSPDTAKNDLATRGQLRLLSLMGIQRLPFVELEASSTSPIPADKSRWNTAKANTIMAADQALVNDIARIRQKHKIVEIGDIKHGMSMFGGGKIEEGRRVRIYFNVGADIADIGTILNKSTISSTVRPESYALQILTTTRLTESDGEELRTKFPFIKAISSYQ